MRTITDKELVHDRLGDQFEHELSQYDTQRRLEILIDDYLGDAVAGKRVLDVGCGLGYFSARLQQRGAHVTATDIGENLLNRVRATVGCDCRQADALRLVEVFGENTFDVVVSSECIEHTPSPSQALRQMARVLKRSGFLSISTPNIVWHPIVRLATVLRFRVFDGLENFSSFRSIRDTLRDEGVIVTREMGLHLFPFQLPLHPLSRYCDDRVQSLRHLMINLCVLGQKQ